MLSELYARINWQRLLTCSIMQGFSMTEMPKLSLNIDINPI